jgi:hypothetical protein
MRLALNAEVFLIPAVQILGAFRLKEDPANSGDALHERLSTPGFFIAIE